MGGVEDGMEEDIIVLDVDAVCADNCIGPEEAGPGPGTFH